MVKTKAEWEIIPYFQFCEQIDVSALIPGDLVVYCDRALVSAPESNAPRTRRHSRNAIESVFVPWMRYTGFLAAQATSLGMLEQIENTWPYELNHDWPMLKLVDQFAESVMGREFYSQRQTKPTYSADGELITIEICKTKWLIASPMAQVVRMTSRHPFFQPYQDWLEKETSDTNS